MQSNNNSPSIGARLTLTPSPLSLPPQSFGFYFCDDWISRALLCMFTKARTSVLAHKLNRNHRVLISWWRLYFSYHANQDAMPAILSCNTVELGLKKKYQTFQRWTLRSPIFWDPWITFFFSWSHLLKNKPYIEL